MQLNIVQLMHHIDKHRYRGNHRAAVSILRSASTISPLLLFLNWLKTPPLSLQTFSKQCLAESLSSWSPTQRQEMGMPLAMTSRHSSSASHSSSNSVPFQQSLPFSSLFLLVSSGLLGLASVKMMSSSVWGSSRTWWQSTSMASWPCPPQRSMDLMNSDSWVGSEVKALSCLRFCLPELQLRQTMTLTCRQSLGSPRTSRISWTLSNTSLMMDLIMSWDSCGIELVESMPRMTFLLRRFFMAACTFARIEFSLSFSTILATNSMFLIRYFTRPPSLCTKHRLNRCEQQSMAAAQAVLEWVYVRQLADTPGEEQTSFRRARRSRSQERSFERQQGVAASMLVTARTCFSTSLTLAFAWLTSSVALILFLRSSISSSLQASNTNQMLAFSFSQSLMSAATLVAILSRQSLPTVSSSLFWMGTTSDTLLALLTACSRNFWLSWSSTGEVSSTTGRTPAMVDGWSHNDKRPRQAVGTVVGDDDDEAEEIDWWERGRELVDSEAYYLGEGGWLGRPTSPSSRAAPISRMSSLPSTALLASSASFLSLFSSEMLMWQSLASIFLSSSRRAASVWAALAPSKCLQMALVQLFSAWIISSSFLSYPLASMCLTSRLRSALWISGCRFSRSLSLSWLRSFSTQWLGCDRTFLKVWSISVLRQLGAACLLSHRPFLIILASNFLLVRCRMKLGSLASTLPRLQSCDSSLAIFLMLSLCTRGITVVRISYRSLVRTYIDVVVY